MLKSESFRGFAPWTRPNRALPWTQWGLTAASDPLGFWRTLHFQPGYAPDLPPLLNVNRYWGRRHYKEFIDRNSEACGLTVTSHGHWKSKSLSSSPSLSEKSLNVYRCFSCNIRDRSYLILELHAISSLRRERYILSKSANKSSYPFWKPPNLSNLLKTVLSHRVTMFPGSLVVRIPRSHRGGRGSIPRLGRLFFSNIF